MVVQVGEQIFRTNKEEKKFLRRGNNFIYYLTLVISFLLILISFLPYGISGAESILQGLGCSGIAASLMSYFIEKQTRVKERNKINEYRQIFLADLNQELKHVIERIIWFDMAIKKINLDKDLSYYLSIEFLTDAYNLVLYREDSFENIKDKIKSIEEKYKNFEGEDDEYRKIVYMFRIIGCASNSAQNEMEKLNRNKVFLITNNIFSEEEFYQLNMYGIKAIELLMFKETNYATMLMLLFEGYEKVRKIGNFNDNLYITWQAQGSAIDLLLRERKNKYVR